jgi:hypothetical protein
MVSNCIPGLICRGPVDPALLLYSTLWSGSVMGNLFGGVLPAGAGVCCPANSHIWYSELLLSPTKLPCCRNDLNEECVTTKLDCPTDARVKYLLGTGEQGCVQDSDCAVYKDRQENGEVFTITQHCSKYEWKP